MSMTTDLLLKYYEQNKHVIPTDGLVFWASLNGQTPNVAETGQTLTKYGTAPTYTTVDGVPCATGTYQQYSISFPGTGLPTGNSDRTLSFWTRPVSTGTGQSMFGQNDNGSGGTRFYLYHGTATGNIIRFNTATYNINTDYVLSANTWHCLLCTYHARKLTFFDNGVKVAEDTISINANTGTGNGTINAYSSNRYGGCPIAACRLYNRVLIQDEITALAHEFKPTA